MTKMFDREAVHVATLPYCNNLTLKKKVKANELLVRHIDAMQNMCMKLTQIICMVCEHQTSGLVVGQIEALQVVLASIYAKDMIKVLVITIYPIIVGSFGHLVIQNEKVPNSPLIGFQVLE